MKAKIIELEEIDSTNLFCKRCNFEEFESDLIVTANRQTAGRGTKGRSFWSGEGGLYLSVMRRYTNFLAADAFKIMVNTCVAVCKTVESFGLNPVIRWANDVLVGGKKICGTLIENTFSGSFISRSIVGIGLNVNNVLPVELHSIATTMRSELGKLIEKQKVCDNLIENLNKNYTLAEYKKYINWLGKEVILKTANGEITVTAVDIAEDGGLLCVAAGSVKKISSAEVTLRL